MAPMGPHRNALIANHFVLLMILFVIRRRRRQQRKRRRFYQHEVNANRRHQGDFYHLLRELRSSADDGDKFREVMRMSVEQFDWLLARVGPRLQHQATHAIPISPAERLAITIRFLASGAEKTVIALAFRVGVSTVGQVVEETCTAIWEELQDQFLKFPSNEEEWKKIASGFEERWQFPNCIGAIDGKHVTIQAPPNSGSSFFNYKKSHSIVLMAACDANYCFTFVDIGSPGRNSDGGVFANSSLGKSLINDPNSLGLPPPSSLPGQDNGSQVPYVLVADEAFPLKDNIMRPFPGRTVPGHLSREQQIFNYRLSRARCIIENAFGILVSKWRIFKKATIALPQKMESYIKAAVVLHNFLLRAELNVRPQGRRYCPPGFADGDDKNGKWREIVENDGGSMMAPAPRMGSNNYTNTAADVRSKFSTYFLSGAGAVPWQDARVQRGR